MRNRPFASSFVFPAFVLGSFVIRFISCEPLLGKTYSIDHSLDDRKCKLDHVDMIFSSSEISCLHLCSTQLASPGMFYNSEKAECTCCSEVDSAPDELPKKVGTKYYVKTERPRDCDDLGERGFISSGIYRVFPNGHDGVDVFCDFDDSDGPWTVIQRRVNDSVSFNRNYNEYQKGFGNLRGSFWLGLDAISNLTLSSTMFYRLKVTVEENNDSKHSAFFQWFVVENASNEYTLDVSTFGGSGGTTVYRNNGQPFSTPDRPRYGSPRDQCTDDSVKGGWWLATCHLNHLNGLYGKLPSDSGIGLFSSVMFPDQDNIVLYATMKLKENN